MWSIHRMEYYSAIKRNEVLRHATVYQQKGHILYDSIYMEYLLELKVLVLQPCPTLCNPVDCNLPGSSVHGFPRQEYQSGLSFPSPGNLPTPGIELRSPAFQAYSSPSESLKKPCGLPVGKSIWSM